MIGYAQALDLLLRQCRVLPPEDCSLPESLGRVLAADLHARVALPGFDNAAMDGFALPGNGGQYRAGTEFEVKGIAFAGVSREGALQTNACAITTGAALPAGADRVVALEKAEMLPGNRIRLSEDCEPGRNVRRAGSDFSSGDPVAPAGQRVDAALVSAAAALGLNRLAVRRRVRVALLATGDELAEPAVEVLAPGSIRDASTPYLHAALQALGADVIASERVQDDADAFLQRLVQVAPLADLVLTTGALSKGSRDFIAAALASSGTRPLFHQVAIRPGKPLLAASLAQGPLLIGLPGNPLATIAGFRFFVVPVLRAMSGMPVEHPSTATLRTPLRLREGLRHFLKARVGFDASGALQVEVLEGQESYRLAPWLRANAWVIVGEATGHVPAGAPVQVVPRDADTGWTFG